MPHNRITSKESPQEIAGSMDDMEVLFIDDKENTAGYTISCTAESASPSKLLRQLKNANLKKTLAQKKLKMAKVKVRRLKKRVMSLKEVLWNVKTKNLLSENGVPFIEKSITVVPLSILKRSIEVAKKKSQGKQYKNTFGDDIKTFAMTLQFLSSKAYLYVRNTFDLALPAPSTIRKWLSKVNCEPGFCENSFNSLKVLVAENRQKKKDTLCSLMLDEMAIKKQIELRDMKTWGYEDYGTGIKDDSLKCARKHESYEEKVSPFNLPCWRFWQLEEAVVDFLNFALALIKDDFVSCRGKQD
ncbi:hypothetical protein JTB14_022463 [Gonioctena quinquepunctata]|nr:hypothetical protein JTB14_022463 [Gonioctena quinquepunctata]